MALVFLIILIAITFIILLFLIALKIKVVLNTDETDLNMTVFWIRPFIKAMVSMENATPVLKLYLFNKRILKRALKNGKNKQKGMNLVQITNPKDIHVNVHYGFRDPFTTGIACGAINIASQFIDIDEMNQTPDFLTGNDYIYLDATAKVNLGSTLIKLLKSKSNH